MTCTDILEINNMAIEDFSYNSSFEKIIEIKEDIEMASQRLLISQPINVYEAKRISHYLNRIYKNG